MKEKRPDSHLDKEIPISPSDPAAWIDSLPREWSEAREKEMQELQDRLRRLVRSQKKR